MMLIPQEPKCEPLLIPVERKEIMSSSYIIIAVFGVLDVLLAAYAFSAYFKKVSSKATEIEAALSQLQEFDEHDYSMRFEDINNVLIKNKTIKEMWRDFSHNLTRVRTPEGKDELYSPVDASDFFRYNLAIKDINNSFWQNYGSIFTGLGILGTFLGLTIGLMGVDLSSSDVAVLKDGIGNLLNGISTAFGTSLLGIAFALIYGCVNKHFQDKLSESVSALSKRIEEMYPHKTVEQWLADGHRESIEQTKAIKNLSQEMAENLGELLDQQLSTNFEELCQKLDEQMKPVFEKLYDAISSLNEGGASAIAGAVNEKAGAQLDAFADVLQNLQETMQRGLEASEKTSAQANTMMIDTMKQIATSLSQGTDEAMKKQQDAATHMGEQMQQLIVAFNQSSEQATNNMLAATNAARQELNNSVAQTKSSAQNIVSAVQEMAQRQSDSLTESLNANKQKVDETVSALQQTLKDSNNALGDAYLALKDMAQTLEDLLKKMKTSSESMQHSAVPIVEATNILGQQLNVVKEHTNRLHEETVKQLDKLSAQGTLTEKSLTRMSDSVSAAENKAVEAWNTYNEGFNGIGNELGEVLNSITSNISQYNQMMNEGMKSQLKVFDDSMATATNHLKSIIDELADLVEELTAHNKGR